MPEHQVASFFSCTAITGGTPAAFAVRFSCRMKDSPGLHPGAALHPPPRTGARRPFVPCIGTERRPSAPGPADLHYSFYVLVPCN
ncbi:hypothetical protein CENSYa_1333 [Cenarchaeum symbiosum A]|uniref:Uncharacterized protein n=1 Tax=Cenarchaeum symbiosum (strain A) TaxID=414004 RepID=A0RX89_CENSY|nr:hypothetical protein CENSYa_1333 [Cenarchaeum symbiosum A]